MGKNRQISDKWLKAAVLGSIWAAVEIIAGSFLHNIRLPFAGTMLSMFSVFLLVAFMRHWNERGIIIRAGIVAALMKSISPSAVIFGPMVAIFLEGLVLELSTMILGRNLAGYMLGGALAVTWALVQKVINFIILFGFDIVKVADSFYQWLVIKTGVEQLPPLYLVLLVTGVYAVAGFLAALGGYYSFNRVESREKDTENIPAHQRALNLNEPSFNNYRILHLLVVVFAVSITLYLVNNGPDWSFIISGAGFLVYTFIRYKKALRYIRKPKVWIQFLVLTFVATFIWEWIATGDYFSREGLEVGLKMIYRALIIIFGFSALSIELRNPIVRSLLHRNGLSSLYISLNLAFSALPVVVNSLPQIRDLYKKRKEILQVLINQSNGLLEALSQEVVPRKNVFILTGSTQSGKTTRLEAAINDWKLQGLTIAGFIAPGSMQENERSEINIRDLETGKTYHLSSKQAREGWEEFRRFYFNPVTIDTGNQLIKEAVTKNADIVILDEIGPMELKGKCWYPSLEILKDYRGQKQVWVVREKLVSEVSRNYMIPEENIFHLKDGDPSEFFARIATFPK